MLCPWGNGVDTHRLWETLYVGSVPVTKAHNTYLCATGLPLLQVDNYKNLSFENLRKFEYSNSNENILTSDYWFKKINQKKINNNQKVSIDESKAKQRDTINEYNKMLNNLRRIKKLRTLERKVKKEFFEMYKKAKLIIRDILYLSKITNVDKKRELF